MKEERFYLPKNKGKEWKKTWMRLLIMLKFIAFWFRAALI